jgi:hypothetical protein
MNAQGKSIKIERVELDVSKAYALKTETQGTFNFKP